MMNDEYLCKSVKSVGGNDLSSYAECEHLQTTFS